MHCGDCGTLTTVERRPDGYAYRLCPTCGTATRQMGSRLPRKSAPRNRAYSSSAPNNPENRAEAAPIKKKVSLADSEGVPIARRRGARYERVLPLCGECGHPIKELVDGSCPHCGK
jgi:hypothetical protein